MGRMELRKGRYAPRPTFKPHNTVSTDTHSGAPRNQPPEAAKAAANRAADTTKEMYRSAALKARDTLAASTEYVRRNPVPVVFGAFAFGAAIGCLLMMARRKATFSERLADEPLVAVREALLGALAPVVHRVHQGYDSARDGAERAMDRVHRFGPGHAGGSVSDRIGRIGHNLKFW